MSDGRQPPYVPPISVQKCYDHPRDLVFAVWTEPAHMKQWLHPGPEWSNPSIEVDLRVGGRLRIGFEHPEKEGVSFVVGTFLEVQDSERLVYTWGWEAPDPHAGVESLVTVTFATVDGKTEVSLTHEQFPDQDIRDRHMGGWEDTLCCLSNYLASAW